MTALDGNQAVIGQPLPWVGAVPEADTWAMLLAGLGGLGFVARRRQQRA